MLLYLVLQQTKESIFYQVFDVTYCGVYYYNNSIRSKNKKHNDHHDHDHDNDNKADNNVLYITTKFLMIGMITMAPADWKDRDIDRKISYNHNLL